MVCLLFSTADFDVPEAVDFKVDFQTANPSKVVASRGKDQTNGGKAARATGGGLLIHSREFLRSLKSGEKQ